MFFEFVPLGVLLLVGLSLASPLAQQSENQTKGREVTPKTAQNLQNAQRKQLQVRGGFEQSQRSSFPNQGYGRPASDGFSDYEDPNFGFEPAYDGFDRRQYSPNGNTGFDSFNFQGFGNGGGWNRPRPRPGSDGLGAGNRRPTSNEPSSNDGNQLGSGGTDDQRVSSSSGGNRGSDNGANGFGNEVRPQNGGQPWTTVRTPVNRIFGEVTVPELAQCIRSCPTVSQYDPICGSDNITYTNRAKFQCARQCGRVVTEAYPGSCATATVS